MSFLTPGIWTINLLHDDKTDQLNTKLKAPTLLAPVPYLNNSTVGGVVYSGEFCDNLLLLP